jgi:hypothetical protein
MNRDGIPNSQHKVTRPKYIAVLSEASQSFAEALEDAERLVKSNPGRQAHVYKIDSTVEIVNGVVSVRNRQ